MTDVIGAERKDRGLLGRIYRLIRFRLIVPLFRSRGKPEIIARGVMVGLFWAMLPFFGFQMGLVFITWLLCRNMIAWDFSLSQALAWTWVTNVFTVIPAYYTYYVTGQLLKGDLSDITGYSKFVEWFNAAHRVELSWWDGLRHWFLNFISDWGVPILMGSLPWTLLTAMCGYYVSLRLVQDYRRYRFAGRAA